jgi:aldehyde:ferredoxin oxidoreductase
LEAKIFSAVTGIGGEGFDRYAERIVNLQRVILIREGRRVPEFDSIPEYNFTEPFTTDPIGRELVIPGSGEEVTSTVGNILDREKFKGMLKEYYCLRGWDPETGLPHPETLEALGLGDLTACFLASAKGTESETVENTPKSH